MRVQVQDVAQSTHDAILSGGKAGARDPTKADSHDAVERDTFCACRAQVFIAASRVKKSKSERQQEEKLAIAKIW